MKKNKILFILFLIFLTPIHSEDVHPNPWDLIIYRPENSSEINEVRCYVKIEDENHNDVTSSCIRRATYEWISNPRVQYNYKRKLFLSGGMAMHLNIKPGKYYISISTPKDEYSFVEYDFDNKEDWESNEIYYDTNNPTVVVFVYPTANDNGFYNGGWVIDFASPDYFKFTIPKMPK